MYLKFQATLRNSLDPDPYSDCKLDPDAQLRIKQIQIPITATNTHTHQRLTKSRLRFSFFNFFSGLTETFLPRRPPSVTSGLLVRLARELRLSRPLSPLLRLPKERSVNQRLSPLTIPVDIPVNNDSDHY